MNGYEIAVDSGIVGCCEERTGVEIEKEAVCARSMTGIRITELVKRVDD